MRNIDEINDRIKYLLGYLEDNADDITEDDYENTIIEINTLKWVLNEGK